MRSRYIDPGKDIIGEVLLDENYLNCKRTGLASSEAHHGSIGSSVSVAILAWLHVWRTGRVSSGDEVEPWFHYCKRGIHLLF